MEKRIQLTSFPAARRLQTESQRSAAATENRCTEGRRERERESEVDREREMREVGE